MPIQPVFPIVKGAPPPLVDEAAAQAQAKAVSRASYLAGLELDRDFKTHVLDGWLQEKETAALSELSTCAEEDVALRRYGWRLLKELRQSLANDLQQAHQDVLAAQAGQS